MVRFTLYKHKYNKDVALMPMEITHFENYIQVKCKWFNIVNKPFDIDVIDNVVIKKDDLVNWTKYLIDGE